MAKITIFLLVAAFVYLTEAAPNYPYNNLFGGGFLNPLAMIEQISKQVNPENFKNQPGNGILVASSMTTDEKGVPQYQSTFAKKNDGNVEVYRFPN